MSNAANLALDGGDPRLHDEVREGGTAAAKLHLINDPNIFFQEYLHYASITRAEEMAEYQSTPKEKRTVMSTLKGRSRPTSQQLLIHRRLRGSPCLSTKNTQMAAPWLMSPTLSRQSTIRILAKCPMRSGSL